MLLNLCRDKDAENPHLKKNELMTKWNKEYNMLQAAFQEDIKLYEELNELLKLFNDLDKSFSIEAQDSLNPESYLQNPHNNFIIEKVFDETFYKLMTLTGRMGNQKSLHSMIEDLISYYNNLSDENDSPEFASIKADLEILSNKAQKLQDTLNVMKDKIKNSYIENLGYDIGFNMIEEIIKADGDFLNVDYSTIRDRRTDILNKRGILTYLNESELAKIDQSIYKSLIDGYFRNTRYTLSSNDIGDNVVYLSSLEDEISKSFLLILILIIP